MNKKTGKNVEGSSLSLTVP